MPYLNSKKTNKQLDSYIKTSNYDDLMFNKFNFLINENDEDLKDLKNNNYVDISDEKSQIQKISNYGDLQDKSHNLNPNVPTDNYNIQYNLDDKISGFTDINSIVDHKIDNGNGTVDTCTESQINSSTISLDDDSLIKHDFGYLNNFDSTRYHNDIVQNDTILDENINNTIKNIVKDHQDDQKKQFIDNHQNDKSKLIISNSDKQKNDNNSIFKVPKSPKSIDKNLSKIIQKHKNPIKFKESNNQPKNQNKFQKIEAKSKIEQTSNFIYNNKPKPSLTQNLEGFWIDNVDFNTKIKIDSANNFVTVKILGGFESEPGQLLETNYIGIFRESDSQIILKKVNLIEKFNYKWNPLYSYTDEQKDLIGHKDKDQETKQFQRQRHENLRGFFDFEENIITFEENINWFRMT